MQSRSARVIGFAGHDLIHAVRSLAKARAFSLVSVVSLGIGIGTVMASLMVIRAMTATPAAIADEGLVELVIIPQGALRAQVGDWGIETWSYPDFEDVRSAGTGMAITGWAAEESVLRLPGGGGVRMDAAYVSANYFATVGVALARGPGFDQRERGGQPEVIVRHDVWQNRLGATSDIIGSTIVVNGLPHIVVGVTPEDYRGHFAQHRHTMDREGTGFELWLPLPEHPRLSGPDSLRFNREADWVRVVGRLSPGTTLVEANAIVSSIMAGLAERHPASHALRSASVEPYFPMGALRRFETTAARVSWLAVAGMVLLVVCLNMSGMVLVRTAIRERELAVRLAVGASRGRLMQYLLAEAVVLATLGGALGTAVVLGTPAAITWWAGTSLEQGLTADLSIIVVCAGLCFATSLVFGLLPAVRYSRPRIMAALKDDAGGGGRRVGRVHRLTAALQAGFAVPFLVICGVMLDQIRTTATLDLGFEPAGLFYVPLDVSLAARDGGDAAFLLRTAQEHLGRAGGVTSVAVADGLPLDGDYRAARVTPGVPTARTVRGGVVGDGAAAVVRAETTGVSAGYLDTIGARILRGRGIAAGDQAGSERVVVISEPLAARLFPDAEPIGEQLSFALEGGTPQTWTVVGVSADLVASQLGAAQPQLFVALAQHPASRVFLIARSRAATAAMVPAFENALAGFHLEPGVIRSSLRTGNDRVRNSRSELAVGSTLAGVTGGVALLLAALGIFGVVGFMVATRTREIGVRIALGATRARVLGGVLGDALTLAVPGVAGGLLLAVPIARELSWYSLGIVEPLVYAAAAATALLVALVAGLPAARRAAAVEPMVAMRAE